ncbi:pyridoxamine 5'-phosphate oxidase family protein [Microbispora sp. ATCC PTA-5024]|uniref:pyridoxamine 5'-phosphate oxidase family protein n=1 Tax=Microbispora sp. ATCC PTA-5024 TaxID=316330 RepID=UPI0003DC659F|nr:pyridoxamine 5'-phosphate oxidase family protein [Microbispora sp. ATCC PTA-5024]ETK35902.1 hypothetical protein MPTA5024_11745 [Microbispora sp. ATCC PTA-5024]
MTSELERRLDRILVRGTLMHLATLRPDGSPSMCTLGYQATFSPDRLYFVSGPDLPHARDLRSDSRVAGCVVADGFEVVAFTAAARELPPGSPAPRPVRLSPGERLYRLDVTEWVLLERGPGADVVRRVVPARP